MSELRIALVAEGPTDAVVIEAALRATLGRPFTLTLLQPEATRPQVGTGWCGVLKWCREFAAREAASLETDPTLPGFDLFVIHVDADVAEDSYGDCSMAPEARRGLGELPCPRPCPPPAAAADAIRKRLKSWLGQSELGPRTVLCVPSKAIDAWIAVVLPDASKLLNGIECKFKLADQLERLPLRSRVRKTRRDYEKHSKNLEARWATVREVCTEADRFSREVVEVFC